MTSKNYIVETEAFNDSIDDIIKESAKFTNDLKLGQLQYALPGFEEFQEHISGSKLYIIVNQCVLDFDKKEYIPQSNLSKAIEHIESDPNHAYVLCYRINDYKDFSKLMREKADATGITKGWGTEQKFLNGENHSTFTYNRNPTRIV